MNERIKELRKVLGLSQDEFGRRLGLTRGAITNIELNKTEPKPLLIDLICREFDVNETWLRTGEGEMLVPISRDEEIEEFIGRLLHDESDSFRKRLISVLAKLTEDEWKILKEKARQLASEDEKKKRGLIISAPAVPQCGDRST